MEADENFSGEISIDELKTAIKKMGADVTDEDIIMFM